MPVHRLNTVTILGASVAILAALASPNPVHAQNDHPAIIMSCGDDDPNCDKAAARYAEQQRLNREAAERKVKVDAEVKRLGEHRRAEAERLVRMREAADAARPNLYYRTAPCTQIPAALRSTYGCGDGQTRSPKVSSQ